MDEIIKPEQRIIPVNIEMKKCFIDYAMSVIVDRALPDARDGLKPVHRRILYAMANLGFTPDKPFRKCAQTVGEVMGKYHPHGDMAIYDSLVRMAQNFSLRYTLIDPHGNFGSRDGDPPAAQRYTAARLSKMGVEMLEDINKDTVDFRPNYDGHAFEPIVLPSAFPNLLVNGSSGIAVGMATNIPPHNISEIVDGIVSVIDDPTIEIEALNKIIKGPDFPTKGIILGKQGIRDAFLTGRGRIVVRARAEIEQLPGNRQRIIVTELPYQVNKARLIEKIAELARDKKIDGITGVNDESGREAEIRIVIELRRDAKANIVLNHLYTSTQMQEAFNVNMLAIVQDENGKYEPMVLNLRKAIDCYILHRKEVVRRRICYELEKAESEAHLLEGLRIAIDFIDEVINIIRASRTQAEARERLRERFGFSERQAEYIVDMRLGQLTGLEREKLESRYKDLMEKINYYRAVLASEVLMYGIIKTELFDIKKRYGDERRTEILPDSGEIEDEDLIQEEENVITMTHFGYIKRLKVDTYRSQKRGGKGVSAMSTREEDFVENLFVTSTHNYILFFTNKGRVLRLKAYQIPEAGRTAKGTAIVNLLELEGGEKVSSIIPVTAYEEGLYLVIATKKGLVKKTDLMLYNNIRRGGINAVVLVDGDELIDVKLTNGQQDLFLVTRRGNSIRFNEKQVRSVGRVARGVTGIDLEEDDFVIGMDVVTDEKPYLLIVTENGFGKRTEVNEYRVQSRYGKGIMTYRITPKTGDIAGMKLVGEAEDLMLITIDGNIIRLPVGDVSILSRVTQGVTLMRMNEGNKIVGIASAVPEEENSGDEDTPDNEDISDSENPQVNENSQNDADAPDNADISVKEDP